MSVGVVCVTVGLNAGESGLSVGGKDPASSAHRPRPDELEQLSPSGLRLDLYKKMFDMIGEMMLGGGAASLKKLRKHDDDPLLYPNLMDDASASAMPKAVVFTSEFDMLRVAAEELAQKLERHGRLLDYVCHPSTTHCWWMMMDHKRSPASRAA